MDHTFDSDYWIEHWDRVMEDGGRTGRRVPPPNPYIVQHTADLSPGAALDAGCGDGAESLYLAARGWDVTAVDIASPAVRDASVAPSTEWTSGSVEWVHADLERWTPPRQFDLVATFYAHPTIPAVDLYRRLAGFVARNGRLLIAGHRDHDHHDDGHPANAISQLGGVVSMVEGLGWSIEVAEEPTRTIHRRGGPVTLHDFVVRARHDS